MAQAAPRGRAAPGRPLPAGRRRPHARAVDRQAHLRRPHGGACRGRSARPATTSRCCATRPSRWWRSSTRCPCSGRCSSWPGCPSSPSRPGWCWSDRLGRPHRRHLRRHPGGGRQGGLQDGGGGDAPLPTVAPAPPGLERAPAPRLSARASRTPTPPEPPMRIALTHNLRLSDSEDEAEFDTRETVDALAGGHRAAGPPGRAHRGLRARPRARWRGSRPSARTSSSTPPRGGAGASARPSSRRSSTSWACRTPARTPTRSRVTLDKQLTKLVLAQHGVPTPRWQYVEDAAAAPGQRAPLPGHREAQLRGQLEGHHPGLGGGGPGSGCTRWWPSALPRYPAGLLVEEFIVGRDVTVPFLEAAAPERGGVLQPVEYVIDEARRSTRRYAIYDYELKTTSRQGGLGARAGRAHRARGGAHPASWRPHRTGPLGIRDLGRIDFRARATTAQVHFLEINALPSLEPGAGIYAAGGARGAPRRRGARGGHPERDAPLRTSQTSARAGAGPGAPSGSRSASPST